MQTMLRGACPAMQMLTRICGVHARSMPYVIQEASVADQKVHLCKSLLADVLC